MKAYLCGAGMASLAAAFHLIRDGGVLGNNIMIFEARDILGGSLVVTGDPESGYSYPGARIFEEHYACALDFFSAIPSVSDPEKSIKQEIEEFHAEYGWYDKCRLLDSYGQPVESGHLGLSLEDKWNFLQIAMTPENLLEGKRVNEVVSPHLFSTNFWYIWSSIMANRPDHSAMEFHRYLRRFVHLIPDLFKMTKIYRTRFNQYEALVKPIVKWLASQGVQFRGETRVTDIQFLPSLKKITATAIEVEYSRKKETLKIDPEDLVFVTNGSQLADFAIGTMDAPPPKQSRDHFNSWTLWRSLARDRKEFGNPSAFADHIEDSILGSFTLTSKSQILKRRVEALTGRETGRGGLMALTGSNWLITFVAFHQPNYINQPEDVILYWGYTVYPEKPGNFVKKPMTECTGAEVLQEVLGHLHFQPDLQLIMKDTLCVPCVMPYGNAIFLRYNRADRPPVVPKGSTNFAFIGQFADVPDDVVFTMEYSVRTAWTAVSQLLKLRSKPPPVFKGFRDPGILYDAFKALNA